VPHTDKELSEELKTALKCIIDHFDDEDRAVRDRQIRVWRKLKLAWENIHHVYFSEIAHDWRIPDSQRAGEDTDQGYYDKPVNIQRAYLESIIAALSVNVPPIVCYPDDAENPLDRLTATAGDKISTLLFRHNNANILWLRSLFIYCTEGLIACYTYPKRDASYGTYKENKYETYNELHEMSICPLCQANMGDKLITQKQEDKANPGDEDVFVNDLIENREMDICPQCAQMVMPDIQEQSMPITKLIETKNEPKSRVCMEVFGGLNVKVPVWARNQKDCPYLIYSYETHFSNVMEEYPELRDKIQKGSSNYDLYEQWGRTSPQYRGEHPTNNVTARKAWLRPASFNIVDQEMTDELRKNFPDGVKVVVVNDEVCHAENGSLDDCWTITQNPLSDYLHFDPIGVLLNPIQDITNDLVSLTVQTIEHGIPQTFADPKVVNFKAYRESEAIPGGIYPATPRSGKNVGDGFYEVKTATLSQEVLPFAQKIQEMGQLVSGALPSLFGGQVSGSRTASEYSMSRAQALQRLQTSWKMLLIWWKDIFGKAIPLYIKEMRDDEKQVQKDKFGNFVNVFIRRSELEGRIGSIELEGNENLPITWNQQKDTIMELFKLGNDAITSTILNPDNIPYVKGAIGLTDYVIPGEDDRQKQYEEIQLLVNSEPIMMPPDPMAMQQAMMMGMPPPPPVELPSIEIDSDVDDHQVEADICRRWLVSAAGRLCKMENPLGYKNVLLHMKMHNDFMKMMAMQQAQEQMMMAPPPPPGPGPDTAKPPVPNAGVPMTGEQNVPTIQ
jgi:hypothetical protein